MSFEDRQIFENYVNFVTQFMNHEVDPHIDFVEYAQGKYPEIDYHDDININSGEKPLGMLILIEIINFMLHDESISHPVLEKVRHFYSSKEVLLQGGMKEFLRSEQFIEFCGGIPAFNKNWSAENFNIAKAVGIFNALGLSSFITSKVKYLSGEENIVTVFHVCRGDTYRWMDFDLDQPLETLDLDLNDAELADLVNDFNLLEESYHRASVEEQREAAYWRDMEDLELFNLKEYIETACCTTVQDDDIIFFEPGLMQCFEILNSFDPKTLANYIGIIAAFESQYKYKLTILSEFLTYFQPALLSVAFELYFDEKENEKVQTMVDLFKASFGKIEDEFPPHTRESRYFIFGTDIDLLREEIFEIYNATKIRAEYENLQTSANDFFQNMINIRNNGSIDSAAHYYNIGDEAIAKLYSLEQLVQYVVEHHQKPLVYYFSGSLHTHFWGRSIFERIEESEKFRIPEESVWSQIAFREGLSSEYILVESKRTLEALTYAYNDYKNWMKENKFTVNWQEEILSRVNLDCKKLFFVSFMQRNYWHVGPTIIALMNFVDFITAFEFGPESPMNPRKFSLINNNIQ